MNTCPQCGSPLTHYRKKYCSPACQVKASKNRARATKRAAYEQQFIGVDGEGINLPTGEHRYVMLSVGDETLWKNGEALDHIDCLAFLYGHFRSNPDKRAAYVGFYLGYDFTCWLKTLSEHQATMLFTPRGIASRRRTTTPMPFPVYIGSKWEIDMLGMRRIRFRPHVHNSRRNKCACGYKSDTLPAKNAMEWMHICDVGSFFQTAFVNVIDPTAWHGETPCTPEEFARIVEGKSKRSNTVTLDDMSWFDEMRYYNVLENRILGEVMRIYNAGFVASGINLNKTNFYGPGQAAQQWLNAQASPDTRITHDEIAEIVPLDVINKWRQSYYGGRFEIFYHGMVPGIVLEYDIQSAYPHAIRSLPCLCAATEWRSGGHTELTLVHATVTGASRRVGALPHRTANGSIIYPRKTRGWYREAEIEAARTAGLIAMVEIHESLTPVSSCNHPPPFAALADLFLQRLQVGKATPHGKALKLVYNSTYGKMAQSLGTPKFANPIYASMITSACRMRLLEAVGTHPQGQTSVVMMATDGIYFDAVHPDMPTKETNIPQLGAWECDTKSNLTLMKPGVYWDDKARVAIAEGKSAKLKSRGISGRALQEHITAIDEHFVKLTRRQVTGLPTIKLQTPFSIVSPRLALARGKWHTAGKVEYDVTRTDSAVVQPKRENARPIRPGLLVSWTPDNRSADSWDSHPYTKMFGFDIDGNPNVDDELFSPDGPSLDISQQALMEVTQ